MRDGALPCFRPCCVIPTRQQGPQILLPGRKCGRAGVFFARTLPFFRPREKAGATSSRQCALRLAQSGDLPATSEPPFEFSNRTRIAECAYDASIRVTQKSKSTGVNSGTRISATVSTERNVGRVSPELNQHWALKSLAFTGAPGV